MSGGRDAFGRQTGGDAPAGAPTPSAGARVDRVPSAPRHGQASRVALLLVLLLAAGLGVYGTMRAATGWAEDSQAAVEFALQRDPLGPRSLLRPGPLRRALDRVGERLRPGDRTTHLTISPTQLTVTVADARDQRRWVTALASGRLRETALDISDDDPGFALDRLRLTPMTRVVAARMRDLAPYAREPSASVTTDTDTGRVEGWSVSVRGVRTADQGVTIDVRGRVR